MNIFLVGPMGSGKSSLGKKLAKSLDKKFIDTDKEIEKKESKTISEIFENNGETYFREKEKELLLNIPNSLNMVIATGGGIVTDQENRKKLKEKNKRKIDVGKVNLIAAGRLHENKGFDILIKSIVNIKYVYLSIAGDGPLKNYLINLSRKLGVSDRVNFLGWRNDLHDIFGESDIFVCPSRHEPLGNVILEAWANKIPVIAASSQGPKELISNNLNGILFPIDNVSLLSKAIVDLVSDQKKIEKLIDNGYLSYKEYFSKEVVTKQYFNFLQRIVG